jgi:2-polyprenyl-6-methoxyphenol hydroxylase-like FAD-dependent oxidoreductase
VAEVENVLVVGAGIGGLGAGAALAQRGIRTEVVEIKGAPNVFGVGINQPGNSLRALQRIGVLEEVLEAGFQFNCWDFHDMNGNLIVRCPNNLASDGIPNNNGLARPELHRILIEANERAGSEIRYGTTVADLTDEDGKVQVTFTDGREDEYDLVVGMDGINSQTRNRLFGDRVQPEYTGSGVWRVTVPRPAEATESALFQGLEGKAGYIPLSEETMYLLLVCPEPFRARYDAKDLPGMLRDRLQEFGGIVGEIRDNIADDDEVVYGPLHEVKLAPPWSKGRVVICGDAAHASTPHLTQGAAQALEDAVVLAEELCQNGRSVEDGLQAFTERRYPRALFSQRSSRAILDAEASVTAETLEIAIEHMRRELPGKFREIDAVFSQPA